MWRTLVVLCAGCSFHASTTGTAPTTDAAIADAAPDAPLLPCQVMPTGTPIGVGSVGPGGGSFRPDIACAAGELPIGFDFVREDGSGLIAVHARCGVLARDALLNVTTTPKERVGDNGEHGTCIIGGTTTVAEQTCPSGQVLVGITVNNIGNSYNSFTMSCQPLTPTMMVAGTKTVTAFTGTGTDSSNVQSAQCGDGQAILSFGLKSGCDQELLDVRCTDLTCN